MEDVSEDEQDEISIESKVADSKGAKSRAERQETLLKMMDDEGRKRPQR